MLAAVLDAARRGAKGSVPHEPGGFRFDVLQDPLAPHRVCVYEVCADEAGFTAHRQMPRFRTCLAATEPMFAATKATRMSVAHLGKP